MSEMSLSSLLKDTGGQLIGDALFARVSTDSRSILPGDLYVALKGEQFDGNQFVGSAVEKGAAAVISSEAPLADIPHITIADTRRALGLIARANRRLFKGPVVAITGSAGKTTCKEMVTAILQQAGSVLATRGNLNNEIGVPLTLLGIGAGHQFAVIEMGASKNADIAYLCEFAEPDVALVTNAMPAHLEGFGSIENVATTKGEIYQSLSTAGVAVINLDDRFAEQWRGQAGACQIVGFSIRDESADVFARSIKLDPAQGLSFTLCFSGQEISINLALLGAHNIANALAASAACLALGIELKDIKAGLEKVEAVPGRLKRLTTPDQKCLIDDTYNANPGAVKAAIDTLVAFGASTCLVLGNMGELGRQAESLHREVGRYARDKGVDQMLVIGEWASAVGDGFGEGAILFDDMDQLLSSCKKLINSDVVLVKGSRSAAMERVVNVLKANEVEQ